MNTQLAAPTKALILTGEGYGLSVAPEFEELKSQLITRAAAITVVESNEQAEAARNEVKDLAKLRNLTEKSRKEITEPVLKIQREIMAKANDFIAPAEAEEKRLNGLIGGHATRVENERRDALRRQQEEERKRLAAEAEAKRKAEEAEKAAKAKEAAMWEDDDAEAKAKEAEAKQKEQEAAEAKRKADEAAAAANTTALVANTQATAGVKFEPEYEVVDVQAFYAAHADLVDLTVKRAPTLARIKSFMDLHNGELPEMPGLRITKKPKVSTR